MAEFSIVNLSGRRLLSANIGINLSSIRLLTDSFTRLYIFFLIVFRLVESVFLINFHPATVILNDQLAITQGWSINTGWTVQAAIYNVCNQILIPPIEYITASSRKIRWKPTHLYSKLYLTSSSDVHGVHNETKLWKVVLNAAMGYILDIRIFETDLQFQELPK